MSSNEELILDTSEELSRKFAPGTNLATSRVEEEVGVDMDLQRDFEKIPDKLEFKIGEVGDIVGVKTYVLRYWETEFPTLKPKKSRHNQRVYEKKDVEMVMMIKKLLYRDRFSIEGARAALKGLKKETKKASAIKGMSNHLERLTNQAQDMVIEINRLKTLFI